MFKYILKRLLLMIPVLLGVAILIFTLMYMVPGDPVDIMLSSSATEAEKENLREKMGFNDPYIVRLLDFLKDLFLHFDLGTSYFNGSPVMDSLMQRAPRTLIMGIGSILVAIIIGIPLGIIAAVYQDTPTDTFSMFVALAGVSVPNFWLAMMMVLLFSLELGWLPSFGYDTWQHYVMPIISTSFLILANLARQSRSSMLEVIRADYVTTAKAKGVSRFKVIMKHALPNAMIPIVTVVGGRLAMCIAGSLIIENLFSIPGIGQYMIVSINRRDYPAIQGCMVFVAFFFGVIMLLVDIIYAMIDPRIKAQYVSSKKRKHTAKKEPKEEGAAG